ncbi:MAG TPA: N-acetyltransferase [Desulfomonilaceae bacterium]|nr:N-acetyltransferase [Desulfomonilaceae bacterium]
MTSSIHDKDGFVQKKVVHETEKGNLIICSNCQPDFFHDLVMDAGLGKFSHYSSIIQKLESFQKIARREGGRITLALVEPNIIVGYNTCWYPAPDERWSALGTLMYELAAVEVSRHYRGLHIARRILELTLDDDFFEDKIAYINGYSWHWDLEGSGLSAAQYRQMMMRLYSPFGFREVYTNEPNIALRDENIMMIRVGSRVSPDDQRRFRYLRFGIKQQPQCNSATV